MAIQRLLLSMALIIPRAVEISALFWVGHWALGWLALCDHLMPKENPTIEPRGV